MHDVAHSLKGKDVTSFDVIQSYDNVFNMTNIIPRQLRRGIRSMLENISRGVLSEYYSGLCSCLLYHRVGPAKFQPDQSNPYSGLTVSSESFDEQMYYVKNNFNCLSLSKAVELLSIGALPARSLVITFDDGYKDNLTTALPILEKYELPATCYITTGLVDRTSELWWYEQNFIILNSTKLDFKWNGKVFKRSLQSLREKHVAIYDFNKLFKRLSLSQQKSFMQVLRAQSSHTYSYNDEILTWSEVEKLDRHPLITIGAHTTNHPALSLLDKDDLLNELCESKERLEVKLGHPIGHLAYPFGGKSEVGKREFEAARESGFISAVTTQHGHLYQQHQEHLCALPRISINYEDSIESFAWKLSGIYSMFRQQGRRIMVG